MKTTDKFKGSLIIALSCCMFITQSQPEFIQHQVTSNFPAGVDVIVNDLDLDGDKDIISVNWHVNAEVAWWKNNGFNEFTKVVILDNAGKLRSVRAHDMNADNKTDLIVAAIEENSIILLQNNGDNTFAESIVDADFAGAHTIDIKDVNDDNHPDILCSGFDNINFESEIAWYENDGQNPVVWTKHLISDRFQTSPFIYGDDMDGDNDLDVIACGEQDDEILWWENTGAENFDEHMIDSLMDAVHTVIARDVDLDGDGDILASACISSKIAWYENNGQGVFIKHALPNFGGALWLDATDVDNDGDRDLFGAGQSAPNLAWWQNNGNQEFTKINIDGGFTQAFCIIPAKMDNDNDNDFVAIGYGSNKISWFENKLLNPNPYNHPESCVYDYAHQRWLISSTGGPNAPGYISEVDYLGMAQYFVTNIEDPLGMCIAEGVLYVSEENSGVLGFDLETKEQVFFQALNTVGNPDGLAYDNDGHLFVVDTWGRIYKIYLETQTVSLFRTSGLTNWTQDIVFDQVNNRLLAIGYASNAPIQAISLADSSVTNYPTNFSNYDGITMDQFGNVYLASHQSPGRIVRYFYGLSGDYDIVSSGHNQPAGLEYNQQNNILAIPNYGGSTVDFVMVTGTEIKENIISDSFIKDIFPNPFNEQINVEIIDNSGSDIEVTVFDINGKVIKDLYFDFPISSFSWDGKNNEGTTVRSGVFFINIRSGNHYEHRKIIKL